MAGFWTQVANLQGLLGVALGLAASPTMEALKIRRTERRTWNSKTAEQALQTLTDLYRLEQMPGEGYELQQRRRKQRQDPEPDFEPDFGPLGHSGSLYAIRPFRMQSEAAREILDRGIGEA